MKAFAVARRDFLDVRRAKLVWTPAALYTLFMLLFFYGQSGSSDPNFHRVLWGLAGVGGALVVPLIALVAAYLALAGERESGRIKFTLGAPVTRADVVLGKLLARSGVVAAGLLLSFVVGTAAAEVLVPSMELAVGDFVMFVVLTLLYAVAYVSVALAISASTSTRSRAIGGAIGFFFVFNIVWNFLPVGPVQMLSFVLDKLGADPADYENLLEFLYSISPTGAYLNSMQLVMPTDILATVGAAPRPDDPFYLEGWFMVVLMALWIAVPLALGYWRFRTAEIG
ncbi:ABC transporter [Halobacteriales archaeon QS_1_68_20]|nr:MAG: ABC transporter [Halobacteriales archaeon QS_1_68_20]